MIANAKTITYGINDIRYITGEARSKKHPEQIYHVTDNGLPCPLDAQGVWDVMKSYAPTGRNVIRMEISPAPEHTAGFTMADWQKLWSDFVHEFDSIEFKDSHGKVYSHRTNVAGSVHSVYLHFESKSGIPHLHAAVCRKDMDGRTNNDHNIHLRARYAAERVARQRGWDTAMAAHEVNVRQVSNDCLDILRSMPQWSWNGYVSALQAKGYTLRERRDSKDILRGYTIGRGNSRFKASKLGKGRNLMVGNLPQTWQRLHGNAASKSQPSAVKPASPVATVVPANPQPSRTRSVADFTVWHDNTRRHEFTHDGKPYSLFLPEPVMQLFDDEFDYRDTSNWQELTDLAVAMFVGLTALDTASPSGGGGGGGNDEGWRDRKDEDDLERARRCALASSRKLGHTPRRSRGR